MKLSIYILTSKNENLVLRALRSVSRQVNHPFDVIPIVMVNSLNGKYFKLVGDALDPINFGITDHEFETNLKNLICLQSESNGKPGKGKNACLGHFYGSDSDYMMLIDGDDFLYPTALQMLTRAIGDKPNVVCGCAQDHLQCHDPIKLKSWEDTEPNLAVTINRDIYRKNEYNLWHQFSIDRLMLINKRHILEFPEDMDLYEDFIFTAGLTIMHQLDNINYIRINNSFIYCYDAVESGQCGIFQSNPNLAQWNMDRFWEYIDDLLIYAKKPIRFSDVKFIKLGSPFGFSHKDKHEYIKELLN